MTTAAREGGLHSERRRELDFTARDLVAFLVTTFAISWCLLGLLLVWPALQSLSLGPVELPRVLFMVAVWAPAIAGISLVGRRGGKRGLLAFLGRLTMWRTPPQWWAALLLGVPLVFYVGALFKGAPLMPEDGVASLAVAGLFLLILGPVEEIGWRGFALPIMQRRISPLGSSLVLGLIWAVWHVPAFALSGTAQSEWNFWTFAVGTVAASVILTALMNAARGSILVVCLFHYQLINPFWPDAQPWDSVVLVLWAAALVLADPESMLRRNRGVLRVIPSAEPVHELEIER